MTELLERIRNPPYGGLLREARLGLEVEGERWRWSHRECRPGEGKVDAWLTCSRDDLTAMLAWRVPAGEVGYRLGDRDIAPRLRQAHAILGLATLGWCGRWPAPDADPEHDVLLREAVYDVLIGPADARGDLHRNVRVRMTDGARKTYVTEGLGDEIVTTLDVSLLQTAVRNIYREGFVPEFADVDGVEVAFHPGRLPLATTIRTLWEMV